MKRRIGRPRLYKNPSVECFYAMPAWLKSSVEKEAKQRGESKSKLVATAIAAHLGVELDCAEDHALPTQAAIR